MPPINEFRCNKCGLELPRGWGVYLYVEDENKHRIVCPHPAERRYVEQVLGPNVPLEVILEKTGFNSFCICIDCLHQFTADFGESDWSPFHFRILPRRPEKDKGIGECSDKLESPKTRKEKDIRECPKCKSKNVMTESELINKTCPKCKSGVIEEIITGIRC